MRVAAILVLSAGILLAAGCDRAAEVRYRVTVEVETPEGPRSGSSVWSWALSRPMVALATPYDGRFQGEAVAVDLPGGRILFALISGQEMMPEHQFRHVAPADAGGDRLAVFRAIAGRPGVERTLRCPETWNGGPNREDEIQTDCPMLVTFREARDPQSVEQVDPAVLAARFGPGYALRRITVQITDDEVTKGLDARLAAMGIVPDLSLDRDARMSTNPTLAERLGYRDFVRR